MANEYQLSYTASEINEKLGKIENHEVSIAKLNDDIAVERARINSLTNLEEGSTTGDAELQDIRVGYDGTTYTSAGEAVRRQVNDINDYIDTTLFDSMYNKIVTVDAVYLTGPATYGFLLPMDDTYVVRNKEVTIYCPVFKNQTVKQMPMINNGANTAGTNTNAIFNEKGYYTFTVPRYDQGVTHIRFVCFDISATEYDKMYVVESADGIVERIESLEENLTTTQKDIKTMEYGINDSVDSKIAQAVNKDLKILFASDIHLGIEEQTTDEIRWGYTDDERMNILIEKIKYENSLGTIDCIVFAGDQVSNSLLPDAINRIEKDFLPEFIERMKEIGIPFYCTNGNHELYTDEKWRNLFGYGSNYIISIKDYDIIVLNNFTDISTTIPTSTGYLQSDIDEATKTSILNYLNDSDKSNAIVVSHFVGTDTVQKPNTEAVISHEKVLCVIDGHCHTFAAGTIAGKPHYNCGNFSTDTTAGSYFSYRIFKDEDGLVQSYAVKPECDYVVDGENVSVEYTKTYSHTFKDESVNYGIDVIKL